MTRTPVYIFMTILLLLGGFAFFIWQLPGDERLLPPKAVPPRPASPTAVYAAPALSLLKLANPCDPSGSDSPGDTIIRAMHLHPAPKAIFSPKPQYPAKALQAHLQGKVTLEILIEPIGCVSKVRVLNSTNAIFDAPSIEAAREWLYETPTDQCGNLVSVISIVRIEYRV